MLKYFLILVRRQEEEREKGYNKNNFMVFVACKKYHSLQKRETDRIQVTKQ